MDKETSFSAINTMPAYRMVSDAIEKQILTGQLTPGDVLPPETRLAEQFGVNRSTVREGIRLLEQGGLLERRMGKRLFVSRPLIFDLASRASRALVMNSVTYQELWEVMIVIEPAMAGYAASRIQPESIEALEANLATMEAERDDLTRFIALDIEFHDIIAKTTQNNALLLSREPIGQLLLPASRDILPKLRSQQRVIDAHRHILEALRVADSETAEIWMRRHIADLQRGYVMAGFSPERRLVKYSGD